MHKVLRSIIALLFFATGVSAQVCDPVLMTVNGKDVRLSEFEYAYNKNNGNLVDGVQTVEEYLPMFIDFKLKVAEAEAMRLDTLSSFKEEYKKDRDQLAEGYLIDSDFIEREAYKVYARDSVTIGRDGFLKLRHIAFMVEQNASKEDVALAKARIDSVAVMLRDGKSFEEVAAYFKIPARNIEPIEILRGQVYSEIENVVYTLADGEYSAAVESPAGFHIIHRISSRPFGTYEEYRPAIISMLEQQNIKEMARIVKGQALAKEFGGNITPDEALIIEDSLLETKYPDFGNLMREYYDGLLFFEVSTRSVWHKAQNDKEGLKKFFKKNRKNYKFDTPRFRGALIQANSQDNLDNIKSILKGKMPDEYKSAIDAALPIDSARTMRVEIGVFAIGDNAWVDKLVFGQGEGGKLRKGFPAVGTEGKVIEAPEYYTDVKGTVTSDYQKYLEEKWVKSLRKKYKVKVNKDVLDLVGKH